VPSSHISYSDATRDSPKVQLTAADFTRAMKVAHACTPGHHMHSSKVLMEVTVLMEAKDRLVLNKALES
jgi:hypothetical protein